MDIILFVLYLILEMTQTLHLLYGMHGSPFGQVLKTFNNARRTQKRNWGDIVIDVITCYPWPLFYFIQKIGKEIFYFFFKQKNLQSKKPLYRLLRFFNQWSDKSQKQKELKRIENVESIEKNQEILSPPHSQSQEDEHKRAHKSAISCISDIKEGKSTFVAEGKKAIQFYSSCLNQNYEELITVKNNLAFGYAKQKEYQKAIQLFLQVIQIQNKYYSIHDDRKLAGLNNLFCAYCENKQIEQANKIWEQVSSKLDILQADSDIKSIFRQNYQKYLGCE